MPSPCQFLRQLSNHRGYGFPDIFRFKGSVLPSCIPVIFCSTIFATIVTVLYLVYHVNLLLPGDLIGAVSVVVGLLLGFSTNNAYDRFYEGRKLFTKMCTHVRNSTRIIWVSVKDDRRDKEKNIKLMLAYVVAIKHHLRWEFDTEDSDLSYLLPPDFHFHDNNHSHGPRTRDTRDGAPENADPNQGGSIVLPSMKSAFRSLASRVPPTTFRSLRDSQLIKFAEEELAVNMDASMCLPLEIIHRLGLYFGQKHREKKVDTTRFDMLTGHLNALIEILGDLERIGNTPIPFAYNLHFVLNVLNINDFLITLYKETIWVLPFVMVNVLEWLTIPAIMFISFVLFGVLAIGAEIENPFGYDENDLPLDDYCKDLGQSCMKF
ncbi:43718_t:CDS:10 [Gigaspora margarita]|uniref:43718_t:CDS:1 n=1 Tax=Gigaspora margarita TaxID=4874 RepID=A0ABN7UT30_GIGMA|nr:43718_t:CDS:10 [Gigaspora margarita]